MRKLNYSSVFLLCCAFTVPALLSAQTDTVPVIRHPFVNVPDTTVQMSVVQPGVTIGVVRAVTSNPGVQSEHPDSALSSHYLAGTLTDLLSQNGMFLKSYGTGGLATASVRGASASQTPVLWNGLDLQSTTNGNTELSLMPSILFEGVSLANGTTASIGGVLQLTTYTPFYFGEAPFYNGGKQFYVKYAGEAGSFGKINNGLKASWANDHFSADVRFYEQHSRNNFTYINEALPGRVTDTLQNALFLSRGGQASLRYYRKGRRNENSGQEFEAMAWYHYSDREIPPTMLESSAESTQHDEFFRGYLNYSWLPANWSFRFGTAVLTENMAYDVGYGLPVSFTNSLALLNEANFAFRIFRKIHVTAGTGNRWTQADVTQYLPSTQQNRFNAHAHFQYFWHSKVNIGFNYKQEVLDQRIQPLSASLGVEYEPLSFLHLKMALGRNYRLPTFNDLYWNPGGNPELKPEDSRNADLSGELLHKTGHFSFSYEVTGYYRYTYNWIQWQPGPGYWLPKNLYEVKSYGVEHRLAAEWKSGYWQVKMNGGLDYVRATNQKALVPGDSTVGKQLMYLPAYKMNGMLLVAYHSLYVSLQEQYQGIRFTSTDHSSYLPAFSLATVTIGKRFDHKKSYADVFFRVNNVFNTAYQAIAWRPMPGRSFEVGLTLDLTRNYPPHNPDQK